MESKTMREITEDFVEATAFIIIVLGLSLLSGCATTYQPICKHNAIYQAMTVQDLTGQPTRLVITKNKAGVCTHAYAQTFRDGRWRGLWQEPAPIFEGSRAEGNGEIAEFWNDYELAIDAWLNWRK